MAGRFRSRPTNHTGVVNHDDWRIRWYEITVGGPTVDRHLGRRDILETFARARAAGDVDALMTLMSDDPVYRPSAVTEFGFEYRGRSQVRDGFAADRGRAVDAGCRRAP